MTISKELQRFYLQNNFDKDGGRNEAYFKLKFKLFSLKLPNSNFRKEVIHMHDIQHIIYNCNTSWKGESFIAGWEIGTKSWKYFPIGMMSLWAMGFSLVNYPKEVLKGYQEGISSKGIIDLKIRKQELLSLSILELKRMLKREKKVKFNWIYFLFWCFVSEIILLFPLLILGSLLT